MALTAYRERGGAGSATDDSVKPLRKKAADQRREEEKKGGPSLMTLGVDVFLLRSVHAVTVTL